MSGPHRVPSSRRSFRRVEEDQAHDLGVTLRQLRGAAEAARALEEDRHPLRVVTVSGRLTDEQAREFLRLAVGESKLLDLVQVVPLGAAGPVRGAKVVDDPLAPRGGS